MKRWKRWLAAAAADFGKADSIPVQNSDNFIIKAHFPNAALSVNQQDIVGICPDQFPQPVQLSVAEQDPAGVVELKVFHTVSHTL